MEVVQIVAGQDVGPDQHVARAQQLGVAPAAYACPVSKRLTLPSMTVKAQRVRICPQVSLR
jgi:hypothetical protein